MTENHSYKKTDRYRTENRKTQTHLNLCSFVFLFVLICVFVPSKIIAEREIRLFVSPEIFELEVERGQTLEDKMIIFNKSELPVPIEIMVTNFGAQEESGTMTFFEEPIKRVGEEDDISYNPRKWIKIENPNFILDPYEREEIKFKIEIPEDAEPGGHYAVALFEPKLPSFYFEKGAIKAIPKIGVLFLFSVKVEGLERTAEPPTIAEFSIPEKFHLEKLEDFFVKTVRAAEGLTIVEKSHLPFVLSIKNNDIYHIKPEGKLEIFRIPLTNTNYKLTDTKKVGEIEIKEITILPGKTRKFPIEIKPDLPRILEKYLPSKIKNFISENLLFGKYQAYLFLATESGKIEKDIEFWAFPWKIALFTVLIACLFLALLIKYRRRIKIAIKVLVRR